MRFWSAPDYVWVAVVAGAVVVPVVVGAAEPVVSVVVGVAVVGAVEVAAVSVVVGAAVVAPVSVAVVAVVAVVSVAVVFSSFLHANANTRTARRHSMVKAFFIISSFIDF